VLEPTDALRRRLLFVVDRVRVTGRVSSSIVSDTGSSSSSAAWNTSSGGTFSPSVRITRAILRLRTSAVLSCLGVLGVGGTSEEFKWGVGVGVACTRVSDDDRDMVSRKMTGRGVAPAPARWDFFFVSITGKSDSTEEESDVLSRDSLEDEAVAENGSGELSELARGWSSSKSGR
jgi:hypothetical protein